jgi:hypothetical protein
VSDDQAVPGPQDGDIEVEVIVPDGRWSITCELSAQESEMWSFAVGCSSAEGLSIPTPADPPRRRSIATMASPNHPTRRALSTAPRRDLVCLGCALTAPPTCRRRAANRAIAP